MANNNPFSVLMCEDDIINKQNKKNKKNKKNKCKIKYKTNVVTTINTTDTANYSINDNVSDDVNYEKDCDTIINSLKDIEKTQSKQYTDIKKKNQVLCKNMITAGICRYGDKCIYAHSLDDQYVNPDRKYAYDIIKNISQLENIDLIKNKEIFYILKQLTKSCQKCIINQCAGGYNCKYGVFDKQYQICHHDLISGRCLNTECEFIHLTKKGLVPYKIQNYNIRQNHNSLDRPISDANDHSFCCETNCTRVTRYPSTCIVCEKIKQKRNRIEYIKSKRDLHINSPEIINGELLSQYFLKNYKRNLVKNSSDSESDDEFIKKYNYVNKINANSDSDDDTIFID
jgi:hypothetical protein